jgi:hypothetical protein
MRKVNASGAIASGTLVRDNTGSRYTSLRVRDRNGGTAVSPVGVGLRL